MSLKASLSGIPHSYRKYLFTVLLTNLMFKPLYVSHLILVSPSIADKLRLMTCHSRKRQNEAHTTD